ncbi:MAG TPA: hypothetical protein VFO86_05825, partial [Terriglobia bacterium]|nr:hypothetical protein [Terriglobia bacterium]
VGESRKQDRKIAERYCDSFIRVVCPLGYHEALIRAYLWFDPEELATIAFTPGEAFLQTPGPRAGEPLRAGANAHSR